MLLDLRVKFRAELRAGAVPKNFKFGTTKSGFGAAYTYVNANGTQRAFVSANNDNGLKSCSETGEACVNNADCPGAGNKCQTRSDSWGLFEIELPIVVPNICWNEGTTFNDDKSCKDQNKNQAAPAPTGNGRRKTRPTSTEAATARARDLAPRARGTDASIPSGRAGTDGCADAD